MRNTIAAIILGFALPAISTIFDPASAEEQMEWIKQIQLSQRQIQNYIGAQRAIDKLTNEAIIFLAEMQESDPKFKRDVQIAVQKNGFANYAEYRLVYGNIAMIMSGLDPKTRQFTEPAISIQKEIDGLKAAPSRSDTDNHWIESLTKTLKIAEPVKFPDNIELVKKNYERIDEVMEFNWLFGPVMYDGK